MKTAFLLLVSALILAEVAYWTKPTTAQGGCTVSARKSDGTRLVICEDGEYRAVTGDQMKAFAQMAVDRDEARQLLALEQQKTAAQQVALDASETALKSCSELSTQTQTLITDNTELLKRMDMRDANYAIALQKLQETVDQAAKLERGGRVAQLQKSPWFSTANDYLIKPSINTLWQRLNGCH